VELAALWEADAKLEALWAVAVQVWDLVLDNADVPCSLAASMSTMVELLKSRIDATAANRVR
jgi:hypothetical protein